MKYNKLIRDRIPEIIKADNKLAITHKASDEEYFDKLREKLKEEVEEFLKSNDVDEIADMLEVLYALCDSKNISRENIENMRKNKAEKRGAFKDKLILDEIREKD